MAAGILTPPLKWHGGKQYLAPHLHAIARRVPYTHRVITHGGGLGEMWDWDFDGVSEVVNDVNGWLTNFWQVLRDPAGFERLRRHLEATPFSQPEFEAAREMVGRTPLGPDCGVDPVAAAAWLFTCCRQSLAGRMAAFAPLSRNRTRRRMNEQASAWLTAIAGLPAAHARMARVAILCDDAPKVIRQQDGPATLFYCDPPYVPESRAAPDVYAFEMTVAQHAELLATLAGVRGRFMLSGYENDLYGAAAARHGWRAYRFDLPNNAAGGAAKRRMTEVVWTNFGNAGGVA